MRNTFNVLFAVLFAGIVCSQDDLYVKSEKNLFSLEHETLIRLSRNMELIYSGFMKQKLDVLDTIKQQCKNHIQKVMADLHVGKETYSLNSK